MTPAQKLAAFVAADLARKATDTGKQTMPVTESFDDPFTVDIVRTSTGAIAAIGFDPQPFPVTDHSDDPFDDDTRPAVPNSKGRLPSPVVRDAEIDLP